MNENEHRRHVGFYRILRRTATWYLKQKFNYQAEPAPDVEGPYFVLANHATDFDPFMVAASFPKHMYFLASEHVYRMGFLSRAIAYWLAPIARVKGGSDLSAVMEMLRAIRKGHSVCFFPEGSRTFNGETAPMTEAVSKLVQKAHVPVITYRLSGGYLTSPRWAKEMRKGACSGQVVRVYQPDELASMTPAQVTDAFNRDLYVNAYEDQKQNPVAYTCARPAEGLEEALYLCPKCHQAGHLTSSGDRIACSCGLHAALDDYGYLHSVTPEPLPFDTILAWDAWQVQELRKQAQFPTAEPFFSDPDFALRRIHEDHTSTLISFGTLSMYADRIVIGKTAFSFDTISGLAIIHRKGTESLVFAENNMHFEISTETNASRNKYFTLYQILMKER